MVNDNLEIKNINIGKSTRLAFRTKEKTNENPICRPWDLNMLKMDCELQLGACWWLVCSTHAEGAPGSSKLAASGPTVIFHLQIITLKCRFYKYSHKMPTIHFWTLKKESREMTSLLHRKLNISWLKFSLNVVHLTNVHLTKTYPICGGNGIDKIVIYFSSC